MKEHWRKIIIILIILMLIVCITTITIYTKQHEEKILEPSLSYFDIKEIKSQTKILSLDDLYKIKKGMTIKQILDIIGNPARISDPDIAMNSLHLKRINYDYILEDSNILRIEIRFGGRSFPKIIPPLYSISIISNNSKITYKQTLECIKTYTNEDIKFMKKGIQLPLSTFEEYGYLFNNFKLSKWNEWSEPNKRYYLIYCLDDNRKLYVDTKENFLLQEAYILDSNKNKTILF